MVDLDKLQKEVYKNKLNKGFDVRDNRENMYKQFGFIQGEVAEAFEAYHKGMPTLGEELADVCLYILGLCEIKGKKKEKEISTTKKQDMIILSKKFMRREFPSMEQK